MSGVYEKEGIRFLYPENWEIVEDDAEQNPRSVSVQSPSGALWRLHRYPADVNASVLVRETCEAMQREYDGLEHEWTSESIADHNAVGCEMYFFCLDLLVVARVHATPVENGVYLFLYQAESRDFDQLKPVFRAMMISLLSPRSA